MTHGAGNAEDTRDVRDGDDGRHRRADGRGRAGARTRERAQSVALRLFSERGYEATSLRDIAEDLGIRKASLYYHFASKEELLRSIWESRGGEAHDLIEWLATQSPARDLAERAVMRWVDAFTTDKLLGIRFMNANPLIMRSLSTSAGAHVGDELRDVVDLLVGDHATPERRLLLGMAFSSIRTAVAISDPALHSDAEVIASARAAAIALAREAAEHD